MGPSIWSQEGSDRSSGENLLPFWMKSAVAITDGLCPQQGVTLLSSQSSLLQKAKEMPVLLTTTLEQDQRGKKAARPHESKQGVGWAGGGPCCEH